LVESFARHLMVAIDTWQEKGFGEVAKSYLAGLAPESGVRRDPDVNGDLLVRRTVTGGRDPERRALVRALAQPSWLDPATGGPRPGCEIRLSLRMGSSISRHRRAGPRRARERHETSAHHTARSLGYIRIRPRGRSWRM